MNLRIIKKYIKKIVPVSKIKKEAKAVFFDTSIYEITELNSRKSDFLDKRLNLLVPSINEEHLFGGISTALKFYEKLCEKNKIKMRIIVTDAKPERKDIDKFKEYTLTNWDKDLNLDKQIVIMNDRYGKDIPVWKNDIFMATAWWTAYNAIKLITWQKTNYQVKNKFIYFIQDFEPGFYPWGNQYLLAESTYKSEVETIAIFNTSLLKKYFKKNDYNFSEEYSFEAKINPTLRKELIKIKEIEKKKKIFIYGRPSVHRNCFNLIIEGIKKCNNLESENWEIISAGEPHPEIKISKNLKIVSKGKLSLEEYSQLLKESYIGISLMASPHPSYPPLEIAAFGGNVITNNFQNKNYSTKKNKNIYSIENVSPDSIAKKIIELVSKFEKNKIVKIDYDLNDTYINDEDPFKIIENIEF
ncbi:hypothetical protein HS141_14450 [Cetobacterium somerae]|uniref:rhamnosyltransferase WsaF family glycosyltransferase n=1 Tax=Cetobacterium somerae TaxID=188913 RepID=UPI00211EE01C|nr:hypothetical protein [Cetobacterium somerae]MCQ9628118.1 hypothetical protein [Cetobacterium somerae]